MSKKVLITVGGTGGHVFPALALADQLQKVAPDTEIQFAGGGLSSNRFFDPAAYSHCDISCSALAGSSLRQKMRGALEIARGFRQSRALLKEWKPDVIVGFGSYHTVPVLMASRTSSIPVVLHEGNRVPGRVNNRFSKHARVTGTHFPETKMEGRALEVGMPLREGYSNSYGTKEEARRQLGLSPNKFTFLVFGGSQGALAINAQFCSTLSHVLAKSTTNFQVLHYTGTAALQEEIAAEYEAHGVMAVVKAFEERMDQAWLAADLAVSRAGAMTVAELIEFEVPAILIPYPHASDAHQDKNADFVVDLGGAIKLDESDLEPERLAEVIRDLVGNDHKTLHKMRRALRTHKEDRRHRDLCSVVCEVAGIPVR